MIAVTFAEGIAGGELALIPGRGIIVSHLVDRWCAGDTIAMLAADYELPTRVIEDAIRTWVSALPGHRGMKVEQRLKHRWLRDRESVAQPPAVAPTPRTEAAPSEDR